MRAITMTTMAAILALLPLAVNFGSGTALLQPLAIAIITGLIVQLPLVLIVLPALLRMLARAQVKSAIRPSWVQRRVCSMAWICSGVRLKAD